MIRFFRYIFPILFFTSLRALPQCAGNVTITVNPQPTSGGYAPGTVVTYCVTMTGYGQAGANWFEGFDVNLGPGWLPGSINPVSPPANCGGAGSGGSWIWLNSSTASVAPFSTFGPGYFFDLNGNGLAGDDFGDAGNCTWTFCFSVTVGNNIGSSLSVMVAPLSDGVAGSWGSSVCDAVNYSTGTPSNIIVNGCLLTATANVTSNVTCFGGNNGAVQINQANGPGPFSYSLGGGPPQSNGSFTGLPAGNYSVVVTAANACTATASFTISQPATGISPSVLAQTNVSCNGLSDAQFTMSAASGSAPYSYSLNGGPYSTNTIFQNLPAGNYTVTVQDAAGCTADLPVVITEPNPISLSVSAQVDVLCFGENTGQVSLSGSGGTPPYSFSFNGAPYGATSVFSNLSAGTYSATIMDISACMANVQVVIAQPAQPLSASVLAQTDVDCFGASNGEVTFSAIGGTAPYSFSFNGGSPGTTPTFSNLYAGPYSVLVQDANGCSSSANVTIAQPAAAISVLNITTTPADCFGSATGSLSLSASGGTAPYSYSCNSVSNSSGNFSALTAGAYNAVITDANACTLVVPFNIAQPANPLTLNVQTQTDVICFGAASGQVTLTASGGTSPYNFSLAGGGGGSSPLFTSLVAGNYSFVVTDANACTAQLLVTISQPALPLALNLQGQADVLCFGGNSGQISVSAVNGLAPYQYTLNAVNSPAGLFSNLTAGNYAVMVTDANACTATLNVQVNQPAQSLQINLLSLVNPLCDHFSDGDISVSVNGGTPGASGYQYQWSSYPSVNNSSLTGIPEGTYTLTVTDSNNCSAQQTFSLDDPDFQISFPPPPSVCPGETINLSAFSLEGAQPVSFSWDFSGIGNQTGSQIQYVPQSSTLITLNATDANGCLAPPFSLPLMVNPAPAISFSVDSRAGCIPFCPVFSGVSDLPNSIFEWSFGNGSTGTGQQVSHCYSDFGVFDVALKVTSPQGCFTILNQNDWISAAPSPLAEFSVSSQTLSMADPIVFITNKSSKDCDMKWDFGDGIGKAITDFEPSYTYKAPGNYCIVLISENIQACADSAEICIEVQPELTMFIPSSFTPNGDGKNDYFEPTGNAYSQIEMNIYSRWGERVFSLKGDEKVRWSGEGFPDGVYIYDIIVHDASFAAKRMKGTVTIIR